MSTQFSSIWPIDRTLSGATTPSQCGPGSDGNEGVLHIPQISSITRTSPSDCLVSYPGHLGGLTPLQRISRWILQPQPTWQGTNWIIIRKKLSGEKPYLPLFPIIFPFLLYFHSFFMLYHLGLENMQTAPQLRNPTLIKPPVGSW